MSLTQDPRTLLFDLIDERRTDHEHAAWDRAHAAVMDGSISNSQLLEALDWAVWRFSGMLTSKLHENLMTSLKEADGLTTRDPRGRMSFHQEWAWKLLNLPNLVATLRTHGNENLFLGIRELVGDRRAIARGWIRYMPDIPEERSESPA